MAAVEEGGVKRVGRHGYRNVERVRPEVEWVESPNFASPVSEVDWAWVVDLLAERPGCWLRVSHPAPEHVWGPATGRNVTHLAPFRPRGSHEGMVVNGQLYLRKFP